MIEYLNSSPERAGAGRPLREPRRSHGGGRAGLPSRRWPSGVRARCRERSAGAKNVYFPEQTHTEVVTSAESFSVVHEFLTGSPPVTTDVEAEPGPVSLAGRAVYFPQNTGAEGIRLKVYEVDPATGKRLSRQWLYTKLLDETGTFGPFDAHGDASYEFELVRPNSPDSRIAHFYPQPFLRSDHLIRLLTSPEGAGIGALIDREPGHLRTERPPLSGVVGRPGRRQRRAGDRRDQRRQPGQRADLGPQDRDVRLRRRLGRGRRRHPAHRPARRAALHRRGRPRAARRRHHPTTWSRW